MAQIHTARNDLAAKLRHTRQEGQSQAVLFHGAALAAGLAAFVFMLFHFELGISLRNATYDTLEILIEKILSAIFDLANSGSDQTIFNSELLPVILRIVGYIVFTVLGYCIAIPMFLLLYTLPSFLRVCLYMVPLGAVLWSALFFLCRLFGWNLFRTAGDEEGILQAGLDGEAKALAAMRKLGRDCHVFTNLRIPYQGRESETDLIVVTPGRITIVEVKNQKGIISGDTSDPQLRQRKRLRDGTFEEKTFSPNPFRQVGTHAYRLKGFLQSRGLGAYVHTCVFFVNEEASLSLTDSAGVLDDKCPAYTWQDQAALLFDLQENGHSPLGERKVSRIVQALEEVLQAGLRNAPSGGN